jgi:nucleotide-binding universal stress UspA family protein
MKRVLAAVSGVLLSEFVDRVLSQLNWADAELYLLHIIDTRPLKEFRLAASALPARTERIEARLREMGMVGAEAGQRMLGEAETMAIPRLPAGTAIYRVQRTGIPEHEIIAAAYETGADLIVLGAAEDPAGPPPLGPPHRPGRHGPPGPPPHHPGPHGPPRFPHRHLSPTVRYVVDHAPCDVLLLYAAPRNG